MAAGVQQDLEAYSFLTVTPRDQEKQEQFILKGREGNQKEMVGEMDIVELSSPLLPFVYLDLLLTTLPVSKRAYRILNILFLLITFLCHLYIPVSWRWCTWLSSFPFHPHNNSLR